MLQALGYDRIVSMRSIAIGSTRKRERSAQKGSPEEMGASGQRRWVPEEMGASGLGWDGCQRPGMGWVGMGWGDGMGGDGMGARRLDKRSFS
jgi:hypothetical protein